MEQLKEGIIYHWNMTNYKWSPKQYIKIKMRKTTGLWCSQLTNARYEFTNEANEHKITASK